jgi:lipoyl(octanoyl) transferase
MAGVCTRPAAFSRPCLQSASHRQASSAAAAAAVGPIGTPRVAPKFHVDARDVNSHAASSSILHAHPHAASTFPPSACDRPLIVHSLSGTTPFTTAWQWQKRIVRAKIDCERALKAQAATATTTPASIGSLTASIGFADRLLLVEHEPIYTLGRNSTLEHLRFPKHVGIRVVDRGQLTASEVLQVPASSSDDAAASEQEFRIIRVERGGEVTFHGPGQLVLYPLLSLKPTALPSPPLSTQSSSFPLASSCTRYRADLHWFLRALESVVIHFLRLYRIEGERIEGASGVWVRMPQNGANSSASHDAPMKKIAAIGLSCTSWITMHGCAINIDNSLEPFDWIVPCGLSDASKYGGVTSLKEVLAARGHGAERIESSLVRQQIVQCFAKQFGLQSVRVETTAPPGDLQQESSSGTSDEHHPLRTSSVAS